MTILVTGGTGTLGSLVVRRLLDDGKPVRILSRHERREGGVPGAEWAVGDLKTGAGLAAAFAGADTVIHCATSPLGGDDKAAAQVVDAMRAAGAAHLVHISIVGIERIPYSYYRTKLAVEGLLLESGVPVTVLRATQFHEFIVRMIGGLAKSPVVPVDRTIPCQPIAAAEVAEVLCELSYDKPAGRVPDLAGPEILAMPDFSRDFLRAAGKRRLLLPFRFPGAFFAGYRAGGHLAPERAVGRQTFAEFLQQRYP